MKKRMNRTAFALLAALGLMMLCGGCDLKGDDQPDTGPISHVALFHASPDAPNLDILVDDAKINNIPFEYGGTTEYLKFSSGSRNLKLRPFGGGPTLVETNLTLEPDKNFSVFVVDESDDASILMLLDNPEPTAAGDARLRFINLSPDSEPMQLKIKDASSALTVGQSFKDASTFMNLEAKKYDFEITMAGNKILELPASALEAGWVYTVFVIGYVTPPSGNANGLKAQVFIN